MSDDESRGNEDAAEHVPEDAAGPIGPEVDSVAPGPADAGLGGPGEQRTSHAHRADHETPDPGSDRKEQALDKVGPDSDLIGEVIEESVRTAFGILSESFSGPIPPAEELQKYTPDQQERIMRMAEAPRTDESERRSAVTKAGIDSNRRSAFIQPALFLVCLGCSAVSFWYFKNNVAGTVFVGYPVLGFLSGVRWNWNRRRNRQENSDSD